MLAYRIELVPDDNDTVLVTCPDLPIVVTYGATEAEARLQAADAIETAVASMVADGEEVPAPSEGPGPRVALALLPTLKLHLYWALRDAGITRAELARRLDWNRESVDRLFRFDHRSRLEQIEAAMAVLGKTFSLAVRQAA